MAKLQSNIDFKRIYTLAELAAMSPRDRRKYESQLRASRDVAMDRNTDRVLLQRAREEARAEGHAEASLSIAKKMMLLGMQPEQISATTGLSMEQLEAIRVQLDAADK